MIVPFSISDFIDRAVQVYGERTAVVDEPDQPAPPLGGGEVTYAELGGVAAARPRGSTSSASGWAIASRW